MHHLGKEEAKERGREKKVFSMFDRFLNQRNLNIREKDQTKKIFETKNIFSVEKYCSFLIGKYLAINMLSILF